VKSKKSLKRTRLSKFFLAAVAVLVGGIMLWSVAQALQVVDRRVARIGDYNAVVSQILGQNGRSRTLILFSNNAEMRYGGGFIGSVGYIDADRGRGPKIDPIHSVYYYDHRIDLEDSRLEAATPELVLMPKIYLRDSGVDLDWRNNAQRAARLFELESGKKVDNVVMMTPNVVRELLKVTGPVRLDSYGFDVTHENFLTKVQLEVEAGADKQAGKDPKTILGVLANTLLKQLVETGNAAQLDDYGRMLADMVDQKQIAVYSRNSVVQQRLESRDLDGGLEPAEGNYLMVAEANIGANKSSPFMRQDIEQKLVIADDGTARVDMVIKRKHTGEYMHQYVDPHDGKTKWLVGDNLSYIKVAVPADSSNISSDVAFSRAAYKESGRSVLTLYSALSPGASAEYRLSYTLPFKYEMGDRVVVRSLLEKPIGSFDQRIAQTVELPRGYRLQSGELPDGVEAKRNMASELVFVR
jgi:hypothetical protein